MPDAAKDPKSAGVASYIIQEEFDRYSGYWWQPTQPTAASKKKIHRILYEEVDESNVELMHITHQGFDDHTDYFRYPRAGRMSFSKILEGETCFLQLFHSSRLIYLCKTK